MQRIVLECKGRLANQILCWTNARYMLQQLGITDRVIVINYPIKHNRVEFPGAVVEDVPNISSLPRVTRNELAAQTGDCLWTWEDVYLNGLLPPEIEREVLQTIRLTPQFELDLADAIWTGNMVGLHVRYGDFDKIDWDNPPAKMPANVRAPNSYYLNGMLLAFDEYPGCRFYLASDAADNELKFLTDGGGIAMGHRDDPLFDLFALSKCRMIIGSKSTFSRVAAQYGGIKLITPP